MQIGRVAGDQERQVLQVLASSAALAIINARLTSALIEQEKVRRELELAAEIQRSLLPAENPSVAGYDIYGATRPCFEIGGDY